MYLSAIEADGGMTMKRRVILRQDVSERVALQLVKRRKVESLRYLETPV